MNNNRYGKVLVLMGGWSNEREISLVSGKYVFESLIASGINAFKLDLSRANINEIKDINPDRVFIVLHGKGGEDGEIQNYLDELSIPYTGSNSISSKICMNKRTSKDILLKSNIPTPRYLKITDEKKIFLEKNKFEYPFVIKPSSEGSSIGVHIVENHESYIEAIKDNKKISDDFIIEEYIKGSEYTVGILDNEALPSIKLVPPGKFYDYEAKYNSEKTEYICPSGLPKKIEENISDLSFKTFEALGCKGWGRVDLIIDEKNNPWVIEVNTIPGMTKHSLIPMAAEKINISFDELVLKILDTSM